MPRFGFKDDYRDRGRGRIGGKVNGKKRKVKTPAHAPPTPPSTPIETPPPTPTPPAARASPIRVSAEEVVVEKRVVERKKAVRKVEKRPGWRSLRPPLSEQLKEFGDSVDRIVAEVEGVGGGGVGRKERVLLVLPSSALLVGKLESKHPSPVRFFSDRAEYTFYHPYIAKQVLMVMYYCHISRVRLDGDHTRGTTASFVFRVPRTLREFKGDHNPSTPLTVEFAAASAASMVRTAAEDRIPALARLLPPQRTPKPSRHSPPPHSPRLKIPPSPISAPKSHPRPTAAKFSPRRPKPKHPMHLKPRKGASFGEKLSAALDNLPGSTRESGKGRRRGKWG